MAHRDRVLNTHYYMPPNSNCVELMSCGYTDSRVIPFISQQCESVGFKACEVKKQSTGLIYNRVWAAIKRECLDVLAEGVAEPKDIDTLFKDWFHAVKGPCQMMDEVGLDTVYNIEKVYIADRGLSWESNEWLKKEYVNKGRLGNKTGGNGLLGTSTDA
jgi:3-hydroxyacyl-CoA dehydrogenase